ncbi:AraC family transcriptional regulator [Vallitalea okinawensis]|uniref:AraC family transcriptional regulator n=1 Tax=Vallitalea okinawensis TaxID=2078660 RepID=UPI000CFD135C|nr:AraC family transcriptional regulator [Vallitalea okinawensis]
MMKTEMNNVNNVLCLKKLLTTIPINNHFRLHGSYNVIAPPLWKTHIQNNSDQHMLLVLGGEGAYYFGKEKILLKKGTIVFVSNNCLHRAVQNVKNPLRLLPLRFGIYNNKSMKEVSVPTDPFFLSFIPVDIHKYIQKFQGFYHATHLEGQKEYRDFLANTFISEVLLAMLKQLSEDSEEKARDSRVERGKIYIEENKFMNIAISEVAKEVGLSERHFRKLFHDQYGLSPKGFQLQIKMSYAKYLLTETCYSVKEIAGQIGYSDPYVFSKQFKNYFGTSPKGYK